MEGTDHPYDSYFHVLTPALVSKVEEFAVLGYGKVEKADIWYYLTKKIWRNPKEGIRIYELVSDVISLNIGDYMNFSTVEAFKSPNIFADLESEELQALLNPKEQ
ncbi:post-transcriptional regulator [Bacillus sp. FJAT-50079]|uniref:post-transcriptional regulator n=1 Tax=Bacillus sp. FJAT-50079 TaxID=2833577 RepID=UPI001BC901AD|nr:post-transcriptional regulator [Bacillus sp. FJAT-50079]MBS4208987.1 post-transcriptional regulator [Bacillus sp. FJAT-50079]